MYIVYVCLCACNVFNSLLVLNAHRHRVYLCVHAIPTPTDGFLKKKIYTTLKLQKIFKLHICEHERRETIMQIHNKIGLYAP